MIDKKIALKKHLQNNGKIEITGKVAIRNREDLSIYYTPGVAYVSEEIKKDKLLAYEYTNKGNTVAIISDGTRILGLGDIGPEAGLAVMEGKALLFKKYGGVDAVPMCISTKKEEDIIKFIKAIEPSIAAVNIEDIESPKVFRIIKKASEISEIPIFHDDQYGTAVVALAALINAFKIAGKTKNSKIVIFGAGSAGYGITKLLNFAGYKNLYVFDSEGVIKKGRKKDMNEFKIELSKITNTKNIDYSIDDAINGADLIIGTTGKKGYFKKEMIRKMNKKPIVFSLTNPEPEISYEDAIKAGAYIVATGKSNSPNQVNNIIAFPGIMRGLLEVRAKKITMKMLHEAAIIIAESVKDKLNREYIIPSASDEKKFFELSVDIAGAVGISAIKEKNARTILTHSRIKEIAAKRIKHYENMERLLFDQ